MDWKEETIQQPRREFKMRGDKLYLSVSQTSYDNSGQTWQYLDLSFGRHTQTPPEQCLKTWPREAIELARKYLAELEASLDEKETEIETVIH